MRRKTSVLLIEDNPGDARLVREALSDAPSADFTVEWVDRLKDAIERLRQPGIDVALLDLSLPDSRGFDSISRLAEQAPHLPIIGLSGLDDFELMQDAVKKGAEDYLVKNRYSTDLLARSIRYAIDRRRAREELAQARDSAIESARLRAEFLANMSHEIRTPLNGIIGMTRLLAETRLGGEQSEMLDIAQQSANSLLRIVNDILDFSKISAGKVTLEEIDFDLGTAVESVIAMFAEAAQHKGVSLASYIDGDVPALLRGDPARLCQILTNLVGNAVKFTPRGEVTVRVALVGDDNEKANLRFSVKDTGIGIPLASQRHLFQAFSQADDSTTRKFGGTGLGLAISAQLVELMGGNIGVRSADTEGSTFWFTAVLRKQAEAVKSRTVSGRRFDSARMLVADPSTTVSANVHELALGWGMRCDTAADSAAALAALKEAAASGKPYDVALIDMQLPETGCLALARAIKSDPEVNATKLIGIYSLGGRPSEAQIRGAGLKAVLVKPIKQSQLFNVLRLTLATPEHALATGDESRRRIRRKIADIPGHVSAEVRARTRILLVEDNVVNQQVQLRLLERLGYRAECVSNGREGIEALARRDYDIVLMDCQMPEMDGYSATRLLRRKERETERHTIVIGVTAHALSGDREECLAAGMDDYISKPIAAEDLAAMLDKWVLQVNAGRQRESSADGIGGSDGVSVDREMLERLSELQLPGESNFGTALIGVFLQELTRRMDAILAAVTAEDSAKLRDNAHALKGASGELGARKLSSICERLEKSAHEAHASWPALIMELEREAASVRQTLEAERGRMSAV